MPENRKDAEARAKKEGFPKSNVICLDGDKKCYIAPKGLTTSAAKQAYAESRDDGKSAELSAKIAWTVEERAKK